MPGYPIHYVKESTEAVYVLLWNPVSGQVWDPSIGTPAFVTYVLASRSQYAITVPVLVASASTHWFTVPATLPEGEYYAQAFVEATAGAKSDTLDANIANLVVQGSGVALITRATLANDIATVQERTDLLPDEPAADGSAMTLTSAERGATADILLTRDMATARVNIGEDVPTRCLLNGNARLVNRVRIVNNVLTVYAEDDSTILFSAALTAGAAGAVPPTEQDPS